MFLTKYICIILIFFINIFNLYFITLKIDKFETIYNLLLKIQYIYIQYFYIYIYIYIFNKINL